MIATPSGSPIMTPRNVASGQHLELFAGSAIKADAERLQMYPTIETVF